MTIPTFTLTGSALDLLDTDDPTPLESVTLTPNTRGQVVSISGVLYRPEPITVTLDEDGKINGDTGIELLANGDDVDLEAPLQWQVQVNTTTGFPRQPKAFWFEAGVDGEIVNLGDVSVSPLLAAQGVSRGPRGVDDLQVDGDFLRFYFRGDPVGDPIPVAVTQLDGGTPYSTGIGTIDGGTL